MKVDFTKIKCHATRKGEEQKVNFAEELGECIYQTAETRKGRKFADLVGDSKGEIEIAKENEREAIALVRTAMSKFKFPYWARTAILGAMGVKTAEDQDVKEEEAQDVKEESDDK